MLYKLFHTFGLIGSTPVPIGPYRIGKRTFWWRPPTADTNGAPQEDKGVLVRIWYPADPDSTGQSIVENAPWVPDEHNREAWLQFLKDMPRWLVSLKSSISTHAFLDLPLLKSSEKFSVLIMSHGLYGTPEMYSSYAEGLASAGFVVIAPVHSDGSALTLKYPDGHVIEFGQHPYPFGYKLTPEEDALEYQYRRKQCDRRVQNVRCILDSLESIQNDSSHILEGGEFLKDRLDLLRVGIFGHSFGGCTALASLLEEQRSGKNRICAGLSLDGWLYPLRDLEDPLIKDNPLEKPFFFINSDSWQWKENLDRMSWFLQRQKLKNTSASAEELGFMFAFPGTSHQNYSDVAVLIPWLGKRMKRSLGTCDSILCMREQIWLLAQYFRRWMHPEQVPASIKDLLLHFAFENETKPTLSAPLSKLARDADCLGLDEAFVHFPKQHHSWHKHHHHHGIMKIQSTPQTQQ